MIEYTPRTWANGEVGNTPLAAAALNNLEDGVNSAVTGVNALQAQVDADEGATVQSLPARTLARLQAGQPVKVTAIGDSILEGNTATSPGVDDCLSLVATTLVSRFGALVSKTNRAVSGCTVASSMVGGHFDNAVADAADLYIIAFGKNDYRSISPTVPPGTGYPLEAHLGGLEHMIRRLRIERPSADIIILAENPDTGASDAKLVSVIERQRELAATYGCFFVDGHKAFTDQGSIAPYMADSVHPNSAGHALLADAILALFPDTGPTMRETPARVPQRSMFGADRYEYRNWIAGSAGSRAAGADGTTFVGTWSGSGPYVSSTAGSVVLVYFTGTEVLLKMTCGPGAGIIAVDVDGESLHGSIDLGALEPGVRMLPITGLSPGPHLVAIRVVSGAVAYSGFEFLPGPVEWLSVASARLVAAGAWGSTGSNAEYYGEAFRTTETIGATLTFDFIGTGFGMNLQRNIGQTFGVAVDGDAATVDVSRGDYNYSIKGSVIMRSGLAFGRHVAVVTTKTTGTRIGGVFSFNEDRLAHPTTQYGLAAVGEAVKYPTPLPGRPKIALTAGGAGNTAPPYAASQTAVGFTAAGTGAAPVEWVAEGSRIAF